MRFTLSDIVKRVNLSGTSVSRSLAGYDDAPTAGYLCPPLTHLRQAIAQVDRQAVTMPMNLVHGRKLQPTWSLLEPQLVGHDSTSPSRGAQSPARNG